MSGPIQTTQFVDASREEIDLIYKIEGRPSEVDIFELAKVLDSFGNVLRESYRVAFHEQGELTASVKPFEQGSFLMEIALVIQQNPAYLFAAAHPELVEQAKRVLENLGFIKKAKESGASLLELISRLRGEKASSVEQKGPDHYEYHANDGAVIPVDSTVHSLYNNSVINNYTFNIVAPAERETVEEILTYLKGDREASEIKIGKETAKAVRAFSNPANLEIKSQTLEDTTTKILHPKSGNYGQTKGIWTFTIAGAKGVIKAKISDKKFLAKYSSGSIRFFQGDVLKVRLKERQIVQATDTKLEYEITEVLEYLPVQASRQQQIRLNN